MKQKLLFIFLISALGLAIFVPGAKAGFGISPPYVKTAKPIFAGSHFEQKITLLRSSAEDDLTAEIKLNAPEIADWVSIDKGFEFDLPKDSLQVPMIVRIDVPNDAKVGDYRGNINIRIVPKEGSGSGVAIALGARVDIALTVTDETFIDFNIRKVEIKEVEELGAPWKWPPFVWFFYNINVDLLIENTGNVRIAPSKVTLEVLDIGEKNLLEESVDKNVPKVEPFSTSDVIASFPTSLPVGQFWAYLNIYKDKEIVQKSKVSFNVVAHGSHNYPVSAWAWAMLISMILVILAIITGLIKAKFWIYIAKMLMILFWPIRASSKYLFRLYKRLKIRFFKWLHRKSAEYKDVDE